ncbi:GNAT family acetyltransferase acetyltransferase [Fusarium denticulatum]|uniref:GNAT family acetyltransferase acetyltransferase n=1 Tax=Fusarium denticulatum TaxID=48507 RepID=A0A8H6CXF0_9HYPO|nr:GNAT family acetyltransferase acetyltransferase [Fusarium denticulatum]
MSSEYHYSFSHVSKTDTVHESAIKYRDLRLRALKASPESFSSTYEIESQFTDAEWVDRLLQDDRENFVCVATPVDPNASSMAQWVGQVTLRGPVSKKDFTLPETSGQPKSGEDDEEDRWQMLSLFILSEHQGRKLGQSLCREVIRHLQETQQKARTVVRLMVKPQNTATVHLYEKLGFETVGKCTLAEALVANGDGHLIPENIADARYSTRSGLIMIYTISKTA